MAKKKPSKPGKVGRPLKFKSVTALEKKIDAYFESCYEDYVDRVRTKRKKKTKSGKDSYVYKNVEKKKLIKPLTITGLAIALDLTREQLLECEGEIEGREKKGLSEEERRQFANTIKRAKLFCQNFAEEHLFSGKQVAGAIFNLKNNYRWREEHTLKHKGRISLRELFDKSEEEDE